MQYVQPVGGLANDPYVDANPGAGQEGSPVPAAAIEHPMRELVALITDAGLAPSGASLTQVATAIKTIFQKASAVSAVAGGTVDAITADFTPAIAALSDHLLLIVKAGGANTSPTPTFTPASPDIAAKTIVKGHDLPLVAGDISGAGFRAELQYDATLDKWVLLNPATGVTATQTITAAGDPTFANDSTSAASTGWVRGAMSAIATAAGFAASFGTNGYIKFPSWLGGLVIQWGSVNRSVAGDVTVTFPITFPTAIYSAVSVPFYASPISNTWKVSSMGTASMVLNSQNYGPSYYENWVAFGK